MHGNFFCRARPAANGWMSPAQRAGVTVVLRDLAQQFPKELEAAATRIRVHLWPERSGRELDFHTPTLMSDYWGSWIRDGIWSEGGRTENLSDRLAQTASDAAGAAKTHEVWLIPHAGPLDIATAARQAHAVCRPPLLQVAPESLCASGALGQPLAPRDTTRFPEAEALISDFFDRTMLPYAAFPLTGFIEWGACPHIRIRKHDGRFVSHIFRTSGGVDYGLRRQAWLLYARSGERKYFEYGNRFNRYCADWNMAHHTVGDVTRGGFSYEYATVHEPLPWRGPKGLLDISNSGHDIVNWLLEYYLCGEEYALESVLLYGEALKQAWNLEVAQRAHAQVSLLRVLTALYAHTWDAAYQRMAEGLFETLVDPDAPTGLSDRINGSFGPLYKENRSALVLCDYWCATGDERARVAFLKLLDYLYRFGRAPRPPRAYQNAEAFLYAIAWQWTGREAYLRLVNRLMQEGVGSEPLRLDEELKGVSDLHALDQLPYRGVHLNMHYLLSMPAALDILREITEPAAAFPLAEFRGAGDNAPEPVIFEKPDGQAVSLLLFVPRFSQTACPARVVHTRLGEVDVQATVETRMPYRKWEHELQSYGGAGGPMPSPYPPQSVRLTVPAAAPGGEYRLEIDDGPDTWFQVLEMTGGRVKGQREARPTNSESR